MVEFTNNCLLPNFHLGKIILCYDLEKEAFSIYGDLRDKAEVLSTVIIPDNAHLIFAEDVLKKFDASQFRCHADIAHTGEVLGGAWLAVINNALLIIGCSISYGPISSRIFRKCMSDTYRIIGMSR